VSAPLQYLLDTDVLSETRKKQADMRVICRFWLPPIHLRSTSAFLRLEN
jgi:hypothetical protein